MMNRALAIGLTVAGVSLLIWGVSASESFSSEVSEAVQGAPSDKAIWLLIAGGIFTLVGLFGLRRKPR
jgi:hypothetical protein